MRGSKTPCLTEYVIAEGAPQEDKFDTCREAATCQEIFKSRYEEQLWESTKAFCGFE